MRPALVRAPRKRPTRPNAVAREAPRFVDILRGEGSDRRRSPTGSVGRVYRGNGIEVVWVSKRGEAIDDRWFSQSVVDILVVLRGKLKVEFPSRHRARVLGPGEVMVLPPRSRCRAYRWPRSARGATIFLAIYPRVRRSPRARRG